MADAFDLDERDGSGKGKIRPLFVLKNEDKLEDDDSVKKWVLKAKEVAVAHAKDRNDDIKENLKLYKGVSHTNLPSSGISSGRSSTSFGTSKGSPSGQTVQVVTNHMYSLTENRVSRIMRYKPSIVVLPASGDDVSDRQAARSVKDLTDYLYYVNDFDALMRCLARRKYVTGEAYMFIEWDAEKGDDHPDSNPESPTKIGDISFRVPLTQNVFLQPNRDGDYEKCDWLLERTYKDEDCLKAEYPDKLDAIKKSDGGSSSDDDVDETDRLENEIEVWTLWHRGTKYLPGGRKVVFTNSGVLSNTDNPYDHKSVPAIRITDIESDGELYGIPIFTLTKQLSNLMNNISSMTYRNIALMSSPKWLVHENASVKNEQLQNDRTKLTWAGQYEPKIAVYNTTPPELLQFEQGLSEKLQQVFGVFGVSRGEPPPGIKAGIALQFLNEQENELMNSDVQKQNAFTKKIWLLALEVASQFYDASDARILQLFGKGKEYKLSKFDPTKLNTPLDIRVQESSSLPDSKAAKTQYLLDIKREAPTAMDDKTLLAHLDLATPESMIDEGTRARQAAEIENQSFFEGTPVLPPESFEDLLTHWSSHFTAMQGCEFKEAPPEIKQAAHDHMLATEMLILDKAFFNGQIGAVKNPAMAQALTMMPNFPAVFTVAAPPPPMPGPPPPSPGSGEGMPPPIEDAGALPMGGPPPLNEGIMPPEPGLPEPEPLI